jgi:DNA-binding SARP family transcriptional activator
MERPTSGINAAMIADVAQPPDAVYGPLAYLDGQVAWVRDKPSPGDLDFVQSGLAQTPTDADAVATRLRAHLAAHPDIGLLAVDMGWIVGSGQGVHDLETWARVADRLAQDSGVAFVSVYDPDVTIEEQLQAIMRAHRQFLSASGLHDNPYWIPAELLDGAPLDAQLTYLLGRVVPDYGPVLQRRQSGQLFARGTTPSWLSARRPALAAPGGGARWHVHCLGRLRVQIGGRAVDWQLPGGAPKKTRTLFAYLLQTGDKGAHADQIGELLWPEGAREDIKRTRLHHTVAMLRKTLGDSGAVERDGEYYRLRAPPGSWIDIDTFEQLCRRGLSLLRRGELEPAHRVYSAADHLYGGDLFEDLPVEYVRSDTDDWCMPRRIWLREMAVKLQYDFARVCMDMGQTQAGLEHCQKALAIDPASEGANTQAMRIFVAQGRRDAMHRQYRQYRAALDAIGATEGPEIRGLYRELSRQDNG